MLTFGRSDGPISIKWSAGRLRVVAGGTFVAELDGGFVVVRLLEGVGVGDVSVGLFDNVGDADVSVGLLDTMGALDVSVGMGDAEGVTVLPDVSGVLGVTVTVFVPISWSLGSSPQLAKKPLPATIAAKRKKSLRANPFWFSMMAQIIAPLFKRY